MLTPQEVQDKRFKQAMWGGYEMTTVDGFLETLTHDYNALFTENATLKKRLGTMSKKLEEYRQVDDDMRRALIEAQKVAEKRIADANEEAERIVRNARTETEERHERLSADIELEEKRLDAARNETISFVNNLRKLYTEQMEKLAFLPSAPLPPAPPAQIRRQAADEAARVINQSLSEALMRDQKPAPLPEPPSAPPPVVSSPPSLLAGDSPTAVYSLDLHDLEGFEREHDTEVPIKRSINEAIFEQNFGHKIPAEK